MKTVKLRLAAVVLVLLTGVTVSADAQTKTAAACSQPVVTYSLDQVRVTGTDPNSQTAQDLMATFNDLVSASNRHSLHDIIKHYNPQFISGDNLTLEQIKNLIQETWKAYPDICYASQPIEIRVNGDWATIETLDRSTATAPPDKDIMDVPGKLVSDSRSLLFLKRNGTIWEITSDSTLWEIANIRYGIGDEVDITLQAPEQVKAGESYSAIVQANVPEGTFTIATIDNQPLTYPHEKVDDKFRPLSVESKDLQRVLKANSGNHNEIVTATIGLTTLEQTNPDRPSLSLNGIATIVKRVNVVPISAEDVKAAMGKRDIIRTSADGKINLLDSANSENTQPFELELAPSNNSATPNGDE